eukprot:scaffold71300_cov48-Phaeocystis_antarctica.AAC.3
MAPSPDSTPIIYFNPRRHARRTPQPSALGPSARRVRGSWVGASEACRVAWLQLGGALGEGEEVEFPLDLLERLAARLGHAAVDEDEAARQHEPEGEEGVRAERRGEAGEEGLALCKVDEPVDRRGEAGGGGALPHGE